MQTTTTPLIEGLLLVNKAPDRTSFSLVSLLRKLTQVRKIGHAGTLDPFATGLMIMLIGKNYTRLSDKMIGMDKEYIATLQLGSISNTFDTEGPIEKISDIEPSLEELNTVINEFQGKIEQTPPMFSAKKVNGKKLYELARKGITIERKPIHVSVKTEIIEYNYPNVIIKVECSKGTYIRSIAHDIGQKLKIGAYLTALQRTRVGPYHLKDAVDEASLKDENFSFSEHLKNVFL